jgi:hypothetical protein
MQKVPKTPRMMMEETMLKLPCIIHVVIIIMIIIIQMVVVSFHRHHLMVAAREFILLLRITDIILHLQDQDLHHQIIIIINHKDIRPIQCILPCTTVDIRPIHHLLKTGKTLRWRLLLLWRDRDMRRVTLLIPLTIIHPHLHMECHRHHIIITTIHILPLVLPRRLPEDTIHPLVLSMRRHPNIVIIIIILVIPRMMIMMMMPNENKKDPLRRMVTLP